MLTLTDYLPTPATRSAALAPPAPRRGAVHVRPATLDDLSFIDALQKRASRAVGFMHRATLEGKIQLGHVLVAERGAEPVGYLIGSDRYFKRDDVGVVYQINVIEAERRGLVAAALLRAQFDRSAYGCRLYCCWCAQDLAANRFWEAMGFVPLAFRTGSATRGSKGKGRVHIFWQKRIRPGDTTSDWWFPSTTNGGAVRGDRIVLPIPPGVHWSDEMPVILPEAEVEEEPAALPERKPKRTLRKKAEPEAEADDAPAVKPSFSDLGRLRLERAHIEQRVRRGELPAHALNEAIEAERRAAAPPTKAKRPAAKPRPKPAKKADPRHVALARELRDKWLEQANAEPGLLVSHAKYDVARQLAPTAERSVEALPAAVLTLPAAA